MLLSETGSMRMIFSTGPVLHVAGLALSKLSDVSKESPQKAKTECAAYAHQGSTSESRCAQLL